jgi:hypothetical protein
MSSSNTRQKSSQLAYGVGPVICFACVMVTSVFHLLVESITEPLIIEWPFSDPLFPSRRVALFLS